MARHFEKTYDEDTTPAIRAEAVFTENVGRTTPYRCPFCGEPSLLLNLGDLEADNYRIELYCDNKPGCDIREFVILATRAAVPLHLVRADVTALHTVEEGTPAEQEALGYELHGDFSRSITLAAVLEHAEDEREARLRNRTRSVQVRVTPIARRYRYNPRAADGFVLNSAEDE